MSNAQQLVADLHPSSSVFSLTAEELREEGYAADFIAAVEAQRKSEIQREADSVLSMVLNCEASWSFAYGWLDRIAEDRPDEAAAIRSHWKTF